VIQAGFRREQERTNEAGATGEGVRRHDKQRSRNQSGVRDAISEFCWRTSLRRSEGSV